MPPVINPGLLRETSTIVPDLDTVVIDYPVDQVSPELAESSDENNEGVWTEVKRRRARSPELVAKKVSKNHGSSMKAKGLEPEKAVAVTEATKALTAEQQEQISRWYKNIEKILRKESPSRGEGTSKNEGKAVDPRNWGVVQLSEEEFDEDAEMFSAG
ncbi:hypothetical protein CVT25_004293 [Psilocybe cyanescens]|uniref:Uncharacterized protein n=1 Tax=Psilocybe cyanescens TaxID=93625 RepID=A0A409XE74_PSICY|nr:hypothetical protein CVT25_004293 [Psilocybe cyanescens]